MVKVNRKGRWKELNFFMFKFRSAATYIWTEGVQKIVALNNVLKEP
jgi:hypothetical protein